MNPKTEPKTGNERRAMVLDTVRAAVCRDRQNAYGDAEDNFRNIADYWNLWLKQRGFDAILTPLDVAMMSALLKTARAAANVTYSDNWVDLAGYAVCGAGIVAATPDNLVPFPPISSAAIDAIRRPSSGDAPPVPPTVMQCAYGAAVDPGPKSYSAALNEAVRETPTPA